MAGNLSTYAGGGNRWITNPKHLSAMSLPQANLLLKTGQTAVAASNIAGFFTALALRGATASISVADTYVTVANLSGSGFLFSAVSPTHTASFTPTIRITVDGTQYVIAPSANQAAGYRLTLGSLSQIPSIALTSTAAVAGDISLPNSAADVGFTNALVGGVAAPTAGTLSVALPTPEAALSYGLPALRFESSLLIEMKASLLSGTANDKSCGAVYRLDL